MTINKQQDNKYDKSLWQRILQLVIVILLAIVIQIPLLIAMIYLSVSYKYNDVINILVSIGIMITGIGLCWLLRKYYRIKGYRKIQHKFKGKDVLINIGFVFLAFISSILNSLLIKTFNHQENTRNGEMIAENTSILGDQVHLPHISIVIVVVLCISVITPYLEELVYRGILTEAVFKPGIFWLPFIVSSAIFAMFHNPRTIFEFSLYFCMGIVFYLAYKRRGNIRDSMMVHMINNFTVTLPIIIIYIGILMK
ncbi:CPBP family intramembrane metalloprotease [Staphylococcus simiae]|uniref:CPBP family intramembrane glutamic endopeptidase n=1 Tax=Staphylococcus simiae TaxID=308354 RepID=UPI001A97618C|nr:type II CAAX endopeptidase family protein [Staphylococcus simiae]MBO1198153.1 CPBP family intramembrane metalloprotease [Staphylococcus simiae]MBO1200303.1 CPBP family intramembrane metalloprotease [Staphylococcus simiae]MBO1202533.1 CPBP family intramembrane metalloprotease [Staphylococcus simiae]MBO1210189.1 CPBP family intramembrane metalloprotease [Staphylococcus simiae]MBO1228677.1 CPBP family intramembrane metalloprotease [Staphylococcus simiae]